MSRFNHRDLKLLSESIRRIYAETNRDVLPRTIVSQVSQVLRAEISTYNEVDHIAGELRSQHDYHSDDPERLFPAFVAYEHDLPWPSRIARGGTHESITVTDFLSQSRFENTDLYNNFYRHFGVKYMIVGYLDTRWGCQVAVSLMRARRDFNRRDRDCLNILIPHLRQASDNAERFTELVAGGFGGCRAHAVELSADLRPLGMSDAVRRLFWTFFKSGFGSASRLPDVVVRWLRASTCCSPDDPSDSSRAPFVICNGRGCLTLRWTPGNPEGFRLLVEETPLHRDAPPRPAETAAGLQSLTPREREVLHWICEGKRNDEIGMILGSSANTVRKQAQRIFAKLNVETRTAAARVALQALPPHASDPF